MDSKVGRGERDDIIGSTHLSSSQQVIDLVRLLARAAAERDYRHALQAQPVERGPEAKQP